MTNETLKLTRKEILDITFIEPRNVKTKQDGTFLVNIMKWDYERTQKRVDGKGYTLHVFKAGACAYYCHLTKNS